MDEQSLFIAALEQPAELRAQFIENACSDPNLRDRVKQRLAAHHAPDKPIDAAPCVIPSTLDQPPCERPGVRIGRYKLLEQIGEGGMGTVWVAEQIEPVRRRVALKLIKPGMDSRQVLSRFDAERQALAIMDHPNIARVLDGGITEEGRPFFVMEYVKGIPMTQFCDDARLGIKERLRLFMLVCHAVQHAHQKGIIHRDLKPSNILVCHYDGQPVPKIIDFGLVKAMHQPLTEHTLYTVHGLMVGTPLYMSPEQAEFNNLDVDTRTDIYSLGVILYELLTGATPLERQQLKNAAAQEILRMIKEEEPSRPSAKISASGALPSIAAQRSLEPAQLSRIVKGDLDWIAMMCLEKDRARRYESASSLARDLQRYLDDEPVTACPPSLTYKVRKLARRHQRAIATGLVLALILITAITVVAGSVGWALRDRQTRQAVVERNILAALDDAKRAIEQERISDGYAAVRQARGLIESAETSGVIRGRVQRWQSDLEMFRKLETIQIEKAALGTESADFGLIDTAYAAAFHDYDLDLAALDDAAALQKIHESPIERYLLAALDDWAVVRDDLGQPAEQRNGTGRGRLLALARAADRNPLRNKLRDAIQRDDVTTLRQLAAADEFVTQQPMTIGTVAWKLQQSDVSLAVGLLRRAHRRYPNDFWINLHLGTHLIVVDSYESVGYLQTCYAQRPNSASLRTLLGAALYASEYPAEAEAELREVARTNPEYALPHYHLGQLLWTQDKLAEAEQAFRHAFQLNPASMDTCAAIKNLLVAQGRRSEAEATFQELVHRHPRLAPAYVALGDLLTLQKKWLEAEKAYQQAIQLDPNLWEARKAIIIHQLQRDLDRADDVVEQLVAISKARPRDYELAMQTALILYKLQRSHEYDQICQQLNQTVPMDDGLGYDLGRIRCLYQARLISNVPPQNINIVQKQLLAVPSAAQGHGTQRLDHLRLVFIRALAAYRANDWAETLQWCARGPSQGEVGSLRTTFLVLRAMAQQQMGQAEQAMEGLASAAELSGGIFPEGSKNLGTNWVDWAMYEIMCKEAFELMCPGQTAAGHQMRRALWSAQIGDISQSAAGLTQMLEMPSEDLTAMSTEMRLQQARMWISACEIFSRTDRTAELITAARRAAAILQSVQAGSAHPYMNRLMARALVWQGYAANNGHGDEAAKLFDQARALDAMAANETHHGIARTHLANAHWDKAAPVLTILAQAEPENHLLAMQTAILHLYRNDRADYQRMCDQLLAKYRSTLDPVEADRTAKACLLADPPAGDLNDLLRLADVAVSQNAHAWMHYFIFVRALAACRQQDWLGTLTWLDRGLADSTVRQIPLLHAYYHALRARALAHLNKPEPARNALRDASDIIRQSYPDAPKELRTDWAEWLVYEILRQQAETILSNGPAPPAK